MNWTWNEEQQLFYNPDTGETLTLSEMEDLIEDFIADGMDEADDLIADYLDPELDDRNPRVRHWWILFSRQLRDLYFLLAAMGIGGADLIIGPLFDSVDRLLTKQFNYLDAMAGSLLRGEISPAAARQRAHMYVNSTRSAYWIARDEFERRRGSKEEHWVTLGDTHVCHPCNDAQDMGWQSIGTFAQPGSGIVVNVPMTLCLGLTSCRCRKLYR